MSVLIKGMEMPKNCQQCPLYLQSMDSERNVYEGCAVTQNQYNLGLPYRPSDCPLVEVPPHGALIDVDKIHWTGGTWESDFDYVIKKQVNMMPTVIEAEEET